MTVCDRGEGGSKIIKNSVTYFMDGPSIVYRIRAIRIRRKNLKNLKGKKVGAHQSWGSKIIFKPYRPAIDTDLNATKMNSTAYRMAEISTKNR